MASKKINLDPLKRLSAQLVALGSLECGERELGERINEALNQYSEAEKEQQPNRKKVNNE